jgi:hypothetical protein
VGWIRGSLRKVSQLDPGPIESMLVLTAWRALLFKAFIFVDLQAIVLAAS